MQEIHFKKKIVFYTLLILLPFLIIVLIELSLRIFSFGSDLRLFVPASDENYLVCNQLVGKRYFSNVEQTTPIKDYFLKTKPDNSFRIFVLGESTVIGFPYDANIAFSRILHRRLQDIFPDRTIEVINLGMTAINSYTLADMADEILQEKPDLILIYTGHNEYYGALGVASMESGSIPSWLKKIHLNLVHLKIYQLTQGLIGNIQRFLNPINESEAKNTLMKQMVGRNIISYESVEYEEGLNQFKNNMQDLLEKFNHSNIPVIISDLVSNIRDMPPFFSLNEENTNNLADSLFEEARIYDAESQFDKAKTFYTRAKDFDVIRFRASEDINEIIKNLAGEYGAYFISLKSLFENHSPNGIVGDNLMTEHLHPNIDGYFLMAEGFMDALLKFKMVENNWETSGIKPWTFYRSGWGFTQLDSAIAALKIKHLKSGWPFHPSGTVNNFLFEYQPVNKIDSLAFMTVKYDDVSSEKVHKDLADYYYSHGELNKASLEYLSLAYTNRLNSSYFYLAADYAAKAEEYENAVRYLTESPNYHSIPYVQITLASLYYSMGNYEKAYSCINEFQKINEDQKNYLYSQKLKYKILSALGSDSEAESVLALIRKSEPDFNIDKANMRQVILVPEIIKPYIEKAAALKKNGKLSDALKVLTEANKVRETAYTNLQIGKILLSLREKGSLEYLEKAHKEIKDDPSLVYSLTVLYLMNKDMLKAEIAMNEFIRLEGEDDPRLKQLKDLYQKTVGKNKL